MSLARSSAKNKSADFVSHASILFVNEQAALEKAGRKLGVKNIESLTQQMRVAQDRAQTSLSDVQYIRHSDGRWEAAESEAEAARYRKFRKIYFATFLARATYYNYEKKL